jgi:hypothetical protein
VSDAGGRISFYLYIATLPSAAQQTPIAGIELAGDGSAICQINLTSAGKLTINDGVVTTLATGSATLTTGVWYRISFASVVTSGSVNTLKLWKDGVLDATATNVSMLTGGVDVFFGGAGNSASVRYSDIYVDDSSSLTDPGDIWVTAKRPVSNGSLNELTTQIGAGGSGYGTGHAPQVNERALSTANGWSISNAAKKTEEYTIEGKAVGDVDISTKAIVDFMGWIHAKVASASTGNIIVAGVATNLSLTTAYATYKKIAGSTTYPTGNTDIGMDTNAVNQLFSLAECGIVVAYTAATPVTARPITSDTVFFN